MQSRRDATLRDRIAVEYRDERPCPDRGVEAASRASQFRLELKAQLCHLVVEQPVRQREDGLIEPCEAD
jgi:hypothetical protein